MRHLFKLTSLLLLLVSGCSFWHASETSSSIRLPSANMRRSSVGLEVATVTLEPDQKSLLTEIFAQLDEQSVAPEARQRLAQNGLRAGTLGSRIPEPIHLLLMEAADRRKHPTAMNQRYADELRFVQCRPSKSITTNLWGIRDLAFPIHAAAVETTHEYAQAQCQVSLTASPEEGGARIRLAPSVESGPLRQRYVVHDLDFHLEAGRDVRAFEELALEASLRPGDVFLVTSHDWPQASLGKSFFEQAQQQKILLIRLAQTQLDDLFAAPDK